MQKHSSSNARRLFTGAALALVFASVSASCTADRLVSGTEALPCVPSATEPFFKPPYVRGVAVNGAGSTVRARVEVVTKNGSSSSTQEGCFTLPRPKSGTATLIATTEDGYIAWRTITAEDEGLLTLVLDQPGAFLELELGRDENTRVAIFQAGVRLHDVTLRTDKVGTFVVPVGDIEFGLTELGPRLRKISLAEGQRAYVLLD